MISTFKNERYTLGDILGEGNFGWVYKAFDKQTKQFVAIKFEKPCKISQMSVEVEVLTKLRGEHGFPHLFDSGTHEDYSYMVMTLLSHTLHEKSSYLRRHLGTETVLNVGIECLERIYTLHSKFYLHRDLKPQQYLIDDNMSVTLIDFGLCKKFMNSKLMMHIPYSDNRAFLGNVNYCSLSTLCGIQQSRRDDLESFCYILSFLLNGKLPWISRHKKDKYDAKEIKKMKMSLISCNLFINPVLQQIFLYVKSLKFDTAPNYTYLFELLNRVVREEKIKVSASATIDTQNIRKLNKKHKSSKSKGKTKKKRPTERSVKLKRVKSIDSSINLSMSNSITMVSDLPEMKNRDILKNKIIEEGLKKQIEVPEVEEKISCVII